MALTVGDLHTVARRVLADPEVDAEDARALALKVIELMTLSVDQDAELDRVLRAHVAEVEWLQRAQVAELDRYRMTIRLLCRRLRLYRNDLVKELRRGGDWPPMPGVGIRSCVRLANELSLRHLHPKR